MLRKAHENVPKLNDLISILKELEDACQTDVYIINFIYNQQQLRLIIIIIIINFFINMDIRINLCISQLI